MNSSKISVVIPFLDEEDNLPELYTRLKAVFAARNDTAEFLFVDDGSTDGSYRYLQSIAAEDDRIRLLRFSRNFGHQAAITAGLDFASGDAVIVMDADLQDPPEVLPELIAKWEEGFEVVYAVRRSRAGDGLPKRTLAAGFYRVFHALSSIEVPVDAGDFRLLDRNVVIALRGLRESHRFLRGMTSWVGFRQCAIEYDRSARRHGATKYPVWKSARLAWDGITSFSSRPLVWMTAIGLIVASGAMLFAFRIIWMTLSGSGQAVSGWASLAVLILFLGGVQLIALGLLGQYISRIFDETKKRPLYVLRSQEPPESG